MACYCDQSTKLGTPNLCDVLSNFRRGDTWMPPGVPWFCTTAKTTREIKNRHKMLNAPKSIFIYDL